METSWQNLPAVKKGNIGEQLVNAYLIEKGFIPYSPDASGVHPFDRLVASKDKRTIFIADSKAKPARTFYPDTGINIKHYEDYKFIQDKYNIDVFLFFVDEDKQEIYGNFLRHLDEPVEIHDSGRILNYPLEHKGIRYFPLEKMLHVARITEEEASAMRQFSKRNKAYE